MTLFKQIVRVHDKNKTLHSYFPKTGIEMVIKPYQAENSIYDVMFRTSDMNPCLSERLLMKDIDNEVERLKFIYSDRIRDSRFKKKVVDNDEPLKNDKTSMHFNDFEDSKNLDSLDKFKSKASIRYGDENKIPLDDNDKRLNDDYIKAKKKYLELIDVG